MRVRNFLRRVGRLPLGLLAATVMVIGVCAWLFASRDADGADVLAIAYSVNGGGYGVRTSGTPERIVHNGIQVLDKSKNGSHCCGFTFWVAMKVAQQRGLLSGKPPYEIKRFQREWYGATAQSAETECALAVVNLGIGREIDPADAQPGDFICFQRPNKSAHTVIFLDWIRHEDVIVGLKYRSSQPRTNGVGDDKEYFITSRYRGASVDPKRFYVARLKPA